MSSCITFESDEKSGVHFCVCNLHTQNSLILFKEIQIAIRNQHLLRPLHVLQYANIHIGWVWGSSEEVCQTDLTESAFDNKK